MLVLYDYNNVSKCIVLIAHASSSPHRVCMRSKSVAALSTPTSGQQIYIINVTIVNKHIRKLQSVFVTANFTLTYYKFYAVCKKPIDRSAYFCLV